MENMRLQKYMWQAWICSRRKAEEYIEAWHVKVNWEIATIWLVINPDIDKVELMDKIVEDQKNLVYYKINKPRWIITTCAEHWEKNIIDIIDIKERVFPIGRLDKETNWLILLTNDGRLTNYLIHPRYEHEKEYVVETFWNITDEALDNMRDWLYILDSMTMPAEIERMAAGKFKIILKEWKNRQIRRMVEKVNSRVKKLKRVRIENIFVWNMKEWEYKHLSKGEIDELFSRLNLEQIKSTI